MEDMEFPPDKADYLLFRGTYSGTQVFVMSVSGIDIMRRRKDAYINATQILKLAGFDKGKRTKILEREVHSLTHEKIQGGYGKYQGTWVPFPLGQQLSDRYGVLEILRPLFDLDPETWSTLRDKTQIPAKPKPKKVYTLADVESPPPSSPCFFSSPLWDSQDTFDSTYSPTKRKTDRPSSVDPEEEEDDDDATPKKRPKKTDKADKSDKTDNDKPNEKGNELVSVVQQMVEAMDIDFQAKLSVRQDEISQLQHQNAQLTKQLENERKDWEHLRYVGLEQLTRAQSRIHLLEEAIQKAGLRDVAIGSSFAIDWQAMEPSSTNQPSSTAIPTPASKKKKRADEFIERQVQELRSKLHQANMKAQQQKHNLEDRLARSQETEAMCKRLIASCCNLPLNKIDDLIGPLTTAIENDPPDMEFSRVIGFMERLRQHQQ
ncbi:apses-domain-containing protein [Hesseltinella vesiculosa]|uniref:Apses-domain-containing protein n=1 Tax=Hesseltinella vesiculosa TaxID=101127 RepID=A0A1X2GB63_9FUNG|nr:apses-domain-containing protein [Hesseltinella vesiculosa]